jgi:hypothetical protein
MGTHQRPVDGLRNLKVLIYACVEELNFQNQRSRVIAYRANGARGYRLTFHLSSHLTYTAAPYRTHTGARSGLTQPIRPPFLAKSNCFLG